MRYSGNSRSLFEYITENNSRLSAIWLADCREQNEKIKKVFPKGRVANRYGFYGLWMYFRGKTIVVSHGISDFGLFSRPSSRKHVVNLWHGIALKRYGRLDSSAEKGLKAQSDFSKHYTMQIASSEIDRYVTAACVGIDARRIRITGYPRNDRLLSELDASANRVLPASFPAKLNQKIVLYAPTFRDFGTSAWLPFPDFSLAELERSLGEMDATILMRPHENDAEACMSARELCKRAQNIVYLGPDIVADTADLLPLIDCVITDYSSIFIDLLLTNTPCIFLPYDKEDYLLDRGLCYDYDYITPGPKVFSQRDFVRELSLLLSNKNYFSSDRDRVKRMFHRFADSNSSNRVARCIEDLVFSGVELDADG